MQLVEISMVMYHLITLFSFVKLRSVVMQVWSLWAFFRSFHGVRPLTDIREWTGDKKSPRVSAPFTGISGQIGCVLVHSRIFGDHNLSLFSSAHLRLLPSLLERHHLSSSVFR